MTAQLPFPADQKLIQQMQSPLGFRAFLGLKLPLAAFAGLRVDEFTAERCAVSLPYGWRTQNPFNSIYFAAQCMAAELSTGALAMLAIQSSNESVSIKPIWKPLVKKRQNAPFYAPTDWMPSMPSSTPSQPVKGWLSTCIQSAPCQMEIRSLNLRFNGPSKNAVENNTTP